MDLLKVLLSYWGLKLRDGFPPNFQCPLMAKLYVGPQKVLELQEHAGVWWGWDFTRRRVAKMSSFLFVCSSCMSVSVTLVTSRLWTTKFMHTILPWRRWSTEIVLMLLVSLMWDDNDHPDRTTVLPWCGMLAWLSVCGEVQICIWPSWCHCHSLSLARVNPDWFYLPGLPFWYQLTRVVLDTVQGTMKRSS